MVEPAFERRPERPVDIRDFIFVRELAEVYLLLDHISGRWDKHIDHESEKLLKAVCAIGWPPDGNEIRRAEQAAILLKVKDRLNAAARPASGISIAFTLLFVGEEDPRRTERGWRQRWRTLWRGSETERRRSEAATLSEIAARLAGTPAAPLSDLIMPGIGFMRQPTRMSLARTAFPGLIGPAARFKLTSYRIQFWLIAGLLLTCLLSWNIAAGNVVLTHLDTLRSQQAELARKIEAAEMRPNVQLLARQDKPAQDLDASPVRFCDPIRKGLPQPYCSVEEYQLCTEKQRQDIEWAITHRNLSAWLVPWKGMYRRAVVLSPYGEEMLRDIRRQRISSSHGGDEETARILALVVGSIVLPVCYGFLGASVAVVRSVWAKLRENTLMPRDRELVIVELVLGATIGACIGLFVHPSGVAAGSQGGMVTGWTLGNSSLSFIAGFGVEGVFLAMEAFVRRVFSVADPGRRQP